jgi:carboxymethylenebutenolidase
MSAVGVAAPNYGKTPKAERLAGSCPVVASYGGRDRMYAREAAKASAGLAAAGIEHDVKLYPEAGHSFMNQAGDHTLMHAWTRPLMSAGFRRDDAEDAWSRIEAFFSRFLS